MADAEGSGGWRYWDDELTFLPFPAPAAHSSSTRGVGRRAGDDRRHVAEGDDVAGFEVVHLPGHAPGLIALWRESDRLALTSDAFYTLDMLRPRLRRRGCRSHGYNLDTEQARASLRKLAALGPAAAWPGHAKPATGDVRAQLERAAEEG